jgi:chlorobactene glucosyltransferase
MLDQSLVTISLASAIISAALGVAFLVTLRRLGTLSVVEPADDGGPTVSVVVPARNEERDLAAALDSLLAQEGIQAQIIVVNDHSTDRTGEIADSIAQSDPRIAVIHNPPLAPGWLGKPNAMEHGARRATGEFLVLADADVIHEPRCFASAIAEFQRKRIDLLSLLPTFEAESFWENALLPHLMIAGVLQFFRRGINDPKSTEAAAAGAFILMRRDLLEKIGGLACVKAEFLDDVSLARAVKRRGFDARFELAPHLLRVRLFKGNRDAFWGLTKNVLGAVDQVWMAVPAMFLPIFTYWVPLTAVVVGLVEGKPALIASGGGAYVVQAALLISASRICKVRWPKPLFFPLAAVPVLCCFTKALYHRLVSGAIAWRGRVISVSRVES